MSTTLTVGALTATTASIAFTNLPGGGTVEIQIADNPQFRGIVTWRRYAATPALIDGLNQQGTYYARGRTVTAGGVLGVWGATEGLYTAAGAAWDTAPQAVLISPALIVPPVSIVRISAGAEIGTIAGYPASNSFRDDPQLEWVAEKVAGSAFFVVQTAGQPVDTFAFLDTSITAGVVQIVGADNAADSVSAAGTAVNYGAYGPPSANLPQRPGNHFLVRLAAPSTKKFHCLIFNGATARQAQVHMRYFVMGLARTAKNISTDKVEQPLDLGSMDRTRAGGPDRTYGHRMRKVDFEIAVMSEMQWETQFADLWRKIGLSEPVLVVPNSRAGSFLHDRILFGTVAASRNTQVNSPIFTQAFSIESLI